MMIPAALIGLAAQLAPPLVRALTGSARAEAVAGSVIGVVEAVTGQPARTEAEAAAAVRAIQANPEAWGQVQTALAGIAAREAEIEHADRASAREREIEARRLGGGADPMHARLVVIVVALLVAAVATLALAPQQVDSTLIGGVIGALLARLNDVYGYYFGSSRGSADKQRTIEAMAGGAQAAPADPLAAWRASR